jgi:surface protein
MASTFRNCSNFNQPLNNWNTSKVTSMGGVNDGMFEGASKFNQNIGDWDVSKVTNMGYMFTNAVLFNNGGSPSINNWNTSNVTTMGFMFNGTNHKFNQPIGNWDTSKVTSMGNMFQSNNSFNQDISLWNVSLVTGFGSIFRNASSFNQNLSSWNLRLAGTSLVQMFDSSGMSCQNYTDTIVGWANYVAANSNTPINVNMATQAGRRFDGTRSGGAGFASASAARTYLTTATPTGAGWTISGDTLGAC